MDPSAQLLKDYAFIEPETEPKLKKDSQPNTEIYSVVQYGNNKLYQSMDSKINRIIANTIIPSVNETLKRYGQGQINDKQVIVTITIEPSDMKPTADTFDKILTNVNRQIAKEKARDKQLQQ